MSAVLPNVPRLGAASALALLCVTALVILGALTGGLEGKRQGPELAIRAYFAGLEQLDADRSVEQVVPEARSRVTEFVENAAGNRYLIVGISLRQPSVLARLHGDSSQPTDATIFLDITQADGARWQAGPRVGVEQRDGRWYLTRPPFWPE